MKAEKKRKFNMPDLTRQENGKSVGFKLEALLKTADKFDYEELKRELLQILNDPTTHISPAKAEYYKENMKNKYTKKAMCDYITNIYMAAANLSMKL